MSRDGFAAATSALLVLVVVAGGLGLRYSGELAGTESDLIPGSADVFPAFAAAQTSYRVEPSALISQGFMLSLISLQGLVNRQGVQIYLDTTGPGNTSFILPLLETSYNVTFAAISDQQFLRNFSSFADGLVVYDPSRPATINVATAYAGVHDSIVVDPGSVETVSGLTGLDVELDLREPPWAGLKDIQLYRRSFQELYPGCDRRLLAILPPSRFGLRDYIIAARVWTFHVGQGPFSSQEDIDFTEEVLAATPRNIPLLGWFDAPTMTEENFLVQVASRHGKSILGGDEVPNISFLTGMVHPGPFKQTRAIPPTADPAEDGIYVSFAVPDGDNLGFIASKMRDIWDEGTRGTTPIAWSVNPMLAALAPPLLDYYYSTASPFDSFVAAPSGAGYIYPGFAREEDLREYIVRAKDFMAMTDMDVVWLLNSFTAREIPYEAETLDAYVSLLQPRGLILDYADQAATLDTWMQGGSIGAAPVIRSTHLWSGRENAVGKIMADVDAGSSRAHFFLVPVYPWSLNLSEAVGALDLLRARYGDRVEAVSVESLMAMLTRDFVNQASRMVDAAYDDVLSSLDGWDLADARALVDQALRDSGRNQTNLAGLHAYLATQHARRAKAVGVAVLFVSLACIVICASFIYWKVRRRHSEGAAVGRRTWMLPGIASTLLLYLFFAGLERALDYYFWTYAGVFVAGALLVFVHRIQGRLQAVVKESAWLVEISVLAFSGLLLLREPWAFVPFACSCAMLLNRFMRHDGHPRGLNALFLGAGIVGGFIARFDWPCLAVCTGALALVAIRLKPALSSPPTGREKNRTPGVNFAATTLALAVIWLTPIQNRYFVERASGGMDILYALSVLALVAAPIIALVLWRTFGSLGRTGGVLSLTVTTGLWVAVWVLQDMTLSSLVLMAVAVIICWSHLSASSRVEWTPLATGRFVSSLLVLGTIVVVLIRMPAIVYSLYITRLPLAVEYILYTPPLLMIFATIDVVQTEALFRSAKRESREADAVSDQRGGK